MDVQAASATAPISNFQPLPDAGRAAALSPPLPPVVAVPPLVPLSGTAVGPDIGVSPGFAALPVASTAQEKLSARTIAAQNVAADTTISASVAKLYNQQEDNVSVTFRIESDPNEVVTVFTDKTTGKTIVQFPSETLVALAQFFNKMDGALLNKKV